MNTLLRQEKKTGFLPSLTNMQKEKFKRNFALYVLLLPGLLCFFCFRYIPLYGLIIAFKDYYPMKGIWGSPWAANYGFEHFIVFFKSQYFFRLMTNTFLISFYGLIWGFPIPIIMAVFFNEMKQKKARNIYQAMSYLPHFLSVVVVCSFIRIFTKVDSGFFNIILETVGLPQQLFMSDPKWFRTIYVASGIWQEMGWSSIIYYAALSNVDVSIIEAGEIDGCNRLQRIWHISLPSLLPTIMTLLLLRIGALLNVGFEKVLLLYSASNYDTSDVLSTYIYRAGFDNDRFSFSAAVGLYESLIRFVLLVGANALARKATGESLW